MVHIDYVDKVDCEQPEEEATDPAGELEELQGHVIVVLVFHLHLGPGPVDDGVEGEVAGVGPVATDDEECSEDSQDEAEDDVKEVEPGVDGAEAAALTNLMALLLRKVFNCNLLGGCLVINCVIFCFVFFLILVRNISLGGDILVHILLGGEVLLVLVAALLTDWTSVWLLPLTEFVEVAIVD